MAKKEAKEAKKVKETKAAKKSKKEEKKVKQENYFVGVKNELSKVKWPSKKEVFKYTFSTIIFIIVLVLFFLLMSLIISYIKGAFN
ncbi:MAG: preprotein translocase subunit SecE [Ruminococcus sp.]|nr:preprotein translocase subunit SecE [Ruminococcus sp.]